MATSVYYNGIELRNVLTREFSQTPIRDPSNTDVWYQQFEITVEALVNYDLVHTLAPFLGTVGAIPGITAPTAGGVLEAVRKKLGEDRGIFTLAMEGIPILYSDVFSDANNGPKVANLKVVQVSPNTIRIQFSITVCKVDCTDYPTPVINNRWSCVDDIDDQYRTRRTWRGRLRLSSAVYLPHAFRGVCVPSIQKGWKRSAMHFNAETNGLELEYFVTDQEMIGEAPPSPAVKMSITHTESMGQAGQLNVGTVVVKLDGARGSDKRKMLERAMQIVTGKLALNNMLINKSAILMQLDLIDHAGENVNSVEARAVTRRTPDASGGGSTALAGALGAILSATIGRPLQQLSLPDYDPDIVAPVGPYGSAGDSAAGLAGLFACYLQTPCVNNHVMPKISPNSPSSEDPDQGSNQPTQITYTEGPLSDQYPQPSYSQDHLQAIYNFARLESTIEKTENRIALPIALAKSAASASPGSDTLAVIRLSPATGHRRIVASFERIGDWPKVITPKDFTDAQGIKHKIMTWKPTFQAPQLTSVGQQQFSVDVEYLFALNRPPKDGDPISVGSLPWDDIPSLQNAVPANIFLSPDDAKGIA